MTDEATREYQLFKRREKAVTAGARLPTEEELLRGMPFFRNDLAQDLREYGDRLARRLRKRKRPDLQPIVACLEELTVEQSHDSLRAFEASLDEIHDAPGIPVRAARLRCLLYRTGFGDADATAAIAGEMAQLALKDAETAHKPRMLWCSLAWSAFSRDMAEQQRDGRYRSYSRGPQFHHELRSYSYLFKNAILQAEPEEEKQEPSAREEPSEVQIDEMSAAAEALSDGQVIVLREVGNTSVSQGKQVGKEFETITGRPLPVPLVPDLAAVRANLVAEFPYARTVIDDVLKGLVGRQYIRMRPTIFVGPPGCGKSRFARRLAEELAVPFELIPCGGMSDSYLGGTPRRWSSGEPSLPVSVVHRHECAGPVIILDEVEKVGTGRHNGNAHDVLLGLFEPETASRWHDPYVQASCDLSHLTWLMTANEVEPIPSVLRDRCRVLRFPEPGPKHLPILALRIMERRYVELGHDPLRPWKDSSWRQSPRPGAAAPSAGWSASSSSWSKSGNRRGQCNDLLQLRHPRKGNLMTAVLPHVPSHPARTAILARLYSKLVSVPSEAADDTDPDRDITPASVDWETTPKRTMPLLHRIAVHEASHAALRLYMGLGTITKITIDAPHGGYVASRTDEFHEQTEEVLTANLSIMLAGRAGEEVITGIIGANGDGETEGSDHELATKLAYDMETAMGFGQKRPLLYRGCADWQFHLAFDPELADDVNRRLEAAYAAACKMVRKQVPAIDYLYRQLLHHGTLEGPELEKALVEARKLITE